MQQRFSILPAGALAAGVSGEVAVTTMPTPLAYGRQLPSAKVIAALAFCPKRAGLFAYERGDRLTHSRAPARRVGLFAGSDALTRLTPAGEALLNAAFHWAAQKDGKR